MKDLGRNVEYLIETKYAKKSLISLEFLLGRSHQLLFFFTFHSLLHSVLLSLQTWNEDDEDRTVMTRNLTHQSRKTEPPVFPARPPSYSTAAGSPPAWPPGVRPASPGCWWRWASAARPPWPVWTEETQGPCRPAWQWETGGSSCAGLWWRSRALSVCQSGSAPYNTREDE